MLRKLITKWLNKKNARQFAIKTVQANDDIIFFPVVKEGAWHNWIPIVRIYDRYYAIDVEREGGFTKQEAYSHIQGYLLQLEQEKLATPKVRYEQFFAKDTRKLTN